MVSSSEAIPPEIHHGVTVRVALLINLSPEGNIVEIVGDNAFVEIVINLPKC